MNDGPTKCSTPIRDFKKIQEIGEISSSLCNSLVGGGRELEEGKEVKLKK